MRTLATKQHSTDFSQRKPLHAVHTPIVRSALLVRPVRSRNLSTGSPGSTMFQRQPNCACDGGCPRCQFSSHPQTVNGLLDERLSISPEFDPNLGEPRPSQGRFGLGLTPPPLITPTFGTCPAATVVERTIDMTPGGLNLGYRTAYGATAVMRVLPAHTNWDATWVTELVTPGANNCPAGIFGSSGPCTGNSTFFIGAPRYSTVLGNLPGLPNRFYDFHPSRFRESVLHDPVRNPTGLNSCRVVCNQQYSCNRVVIGQHTITRDYRKGLHAGRDVTIVEVTKT
jgi:hypothetical protein